MVVTEYIPPKDGTPGLYKIKTSHGEYGGELGQRGYILVEDKVVKCFNIEFVRVEILKEED